MLNSEIKNSLKVLENQQILLYPTDTVWGIGCDATDKEAVAKVFKIKKRSESKSLIILVDGIEMLKKYIPTISNNVIELLSKTENPTTIIYNNPIGLAKNVVAEDDTVAIRIPNNEFCKQLISAFGKPIVSTSANVSGYPTPNCYEEIDTAILDTVDYIVNLHREKINKQSSQIIKIDQSGGIVYIRK